MRNKEIKNNLLYLLISILVLVAHAFLILSITNRYMDGSGSVDSTRGRVILSLIYVPMLIAYVLYIIKIFKKLKYFDFLHFVVFFFNIFSLIFGACGGLFGYYCGPIIIILAIPCLIAALLCLSLDITNWIHYIADWIRNRKR